MMETGKCILMSQLLGFHSSVAVTHLSSEQFIHLGGLCRFNYLTKYHTSLIHTHSKNKTVISSSSLFAFPVLTEAQKYHSSPLIQIQKHEEQTCNINTSSNLEPFSLSTPNYLLYS